MSHTAAVTTAGALYTWGEARHGCLGHLADDEVFVFGFGCRVMVTLTLISSAASGRAPRWPRARRRRRAARRRRRADPHARRARGCVRRAAQRQGCGRRERDAPARGAVARGRPRRRGLGLAVPHARRLRPRRAVGQRQGRHRERPRRGRAVVGGVTAIAADDGVSGVAETAAARDNAIGVLGAACVRLGTDVARRITASGGAPPSHLPYAKCILTLSAIMHWYKNDQVHSEHEPPQIPGEIGSCSRR